MERTRNLPKVTQLESMSEPRLTLRVPPITTVGTASIPYPPPQECGLCGPSIDTDPQSGAHSGLWDFIGYAGNSSAFYLQLSGLRPRVASLSLSFPMFSGTGLGSQRVHRAFPAPGWLAEELLG